MIRVFVDVLEEAAPFRVEVRAESISQAVGSIEERHPGRPVQVVFPIDPKEFFVADPKETGAGQDESEWLRSLRAPVMRV